MGMKATNTFSAGYAEKAKDAGRRTQISLRDAPTADEEWNGDALQGKKLGLHLDERSLLAA